MELGITVILFLDRLSVFRLTFAFRTKGYNTKRLIEKSTPSKFFKLAIDSGRLAILLLLAANQKSCDIFPNFSGRKLILLIETSNSFKFFSSHNALGRTLN